MITVKEIIGLKDYLKDTYYSKLRSEQQVDRNFYNDTFDVSDIIVPESPVPILRTGKARRLIDGPADHIITSNPQSTRKVVKGTDKEAKTSKEINNMLNLEWLPTFKRQNPNAYKQHVKYNLLSGEAWIQVLHNEAWTMKNSDKSGIPVILRIVDPMITYASPSENDEGIPEFVLLHFERPVSLIKLRYPDWKNPKNKQDTDSITWIEYWDKDARYYEADGEGIFEGEVQENPYGFVPFVHKLSGFGTDSPDGKPEDLIVGRLRFSRDTLKRQCALVSALDFSIQTFSNRSFDVQGDDQHPVPTDFADKYIVGTGIMHEIPNGIKVTRSEEALPEPQIFQYLFSVSADLEREDPLAISGMPVGESGRLQDMTKSDALVRYRPIVENTEMAFSTAIKMGLKIMDKIPGLNPKKIDFDGNYEVEVKLQAEDPLENDRKATLGSRLLSAKEIDPITNLTDFKGYTPEKAESIMIDTMKWEVLMTNPLIREFLAWKAIQKSGMAEELEQFKMMQGQQQGGGINQPTNNQQQRARGETQSMEGFNMIDMALSQRGQRQAPVAYNRSG